MTKMFYLFKRESNINSKVISGGKAWIFVGNQMSYLYCRHSKMLAANWVV